MKMKGTKFLFVSLSTMLVFSLTGCKKSEKDNEKPKGEPSEVAMSNFVEKIGTGGYSITSDCITTSVYSKNLITFYYTDAPRNNFALMTLDNGETYRASLDESGLSGNTFVDKADAMTLATKLLPNYWLDDEISNGDIWKVFTKDASSQFRYTTDSDFVKESIGYFAGLSDSDVALLKNISLEFDQEELTLAHLISYITPLQGESTKVDITLSFGNNVPFDQRCLDWMNNSNRTYPDDVSKDGKWPELYKSIINSVFHVENCEDPIPFASFASYATNINYDTYRETDTVVIHDYHATKGNMVTYIQTLSANGFTSVLTEGETVYRKYLRSKEGTEFRCYSDIKLNFSDGLQITAKKYYNGFTYYGVDDVNGILSYASSDFAPLEKSDTYSSLIGKNSPMEKTELSLWEHNYSFYMILDVKYSDKEAVEDYIQAYASSLVEAGFIANLEEKTYTFTDAQAVRVFAYKFDENEELKFLFSVEDFLDIAAAVEAISESGFPEISSEELFRVLDLSKYYEMQEGSKYAHVYDAILSFEDEEEASSFYDDYIKACVDAKFVEFSAVEFDVGFLSLDMKLTVFLSLEEASIHTRFFIK